MRSVLIFLALFVPAVAVADERVPLHEDPYLEVGLRIVAQGYFMRKNCDEVSMRYLKALGLVRSLHARGEELGYSDDEMQAYLDNKHHKKRVEDLARAELVALGMDFDDPSTYCPVAKSQIAAGTLFGPYFRVN